MSETIAKAQHANIEIIAFGDLFLEDIRAYREQQMQNTGIEPIFPLWGRETRELATEMMNLGLRAKLTCVDPKSLPVSYAGRDFDQTLLNGLPKKVDPCGERGEFHTVVYAGPMFQAPLRLCPGDTVIRDGFAYADFALELSS